LRTRTATSYVETTQVILVSTFTPQTQFVFSTVFNTVQQLITTTILISGGYDRVRVTSTTSQTVVATATALPTAIAIAANRHRHDCINNLLGLLNNLVARTSCTQLTLDDGIADDTQSGLITLQFSPDHTDAECRSQLKQRLDTLIRYFSCAHVTIAAERPNAIVLRASGRLRRQDTSTAPLKGRFNIFRAINSMMAFIVRAI
jgi:hypothetical protein